jgi:hypothetical protein
MNDATRALGQALGEKLGAEWCTAPGGGFFVKGHGHVTLAQARRLTGIAAQAGPKREMATTGAQGEWNAFAGLVLAVSRASR